MIITRAKNQRAVKQIIIDFVKLNKSFPVTNVALELTLTNFIKYFAKHIMDRVVEEDCYTVDMLEDIERLNDE